MANKLSKGDTGEGVAAVHKLLKAHGITVPADEVAKKAFGPGTDAAVAAFQRSKGLTETKEVSAETAKLLASQPAAATAGAPPVATAEIKAALKDIVDLTASEPDPAAVLDTHPPDAKGSDHLVAGQIVFDHGLPAEGITLRVYNKGFGGDTKINEVKTSATGAYSLAFSTAGQPLNLEIRAVDSQGKEVSLSETKFNAGKQETLNLVAPRDIQKLAPEFTRLRADVEKQVSLDKLGSAQEGGARQDLTVLSNTTNWDARLLALAATATKLTTETGIPQDALYGLFRAGLPTDKQQLAQVSDTAFERVLNKARAAGVVGLTDQQVTDAKNSFTKFVRTTRLTTTAPGTVSSFKALLDVAGPSAATKLTANEKDTFADIYFSHQGTGGELWQKARERGVPEVKINALRLEGKLAYLTVNNAILVASLQTEIGSTENLAQLVDKDLYKQEAWKSRLTANQIPAAFEGGVDAYAAELARKVRISFPTQVVARMVQKDELRLGENHQAVKEPVRTFLNNAVQQGFELGRTPFRAFIDANSKTAFNGIPSASVKATTEAVETLHRMYQITPSDEALSTAIRLGFRSAHDVTAYPKERFLELFAPQFRTPDEALLFYKKSEQITTVVYNFVTAAKQLDTTPPIYVVSAPAADRASAKNELIKQFPTMESLFGSLDFCECEHCRSVLSPAAYLVDLLQFLDPKPSVWTSTMADWKFKHNGAAYPFLNPKAANDFLTAWRAAHPGQPDPNTEKTPYEVLIERRPDLPQLSLTCENTNTALPYIDIVNEILEYFVAKEKLDEEAVRNTGAATTPELLAEPQNVTPAAYDKLKRAVYPLSLPFDLWLETVRQFFEHSEASLSEVLELLRPADDLLPPPNNPKSYYRDSIFLESLRISPAEREIFSSKQPLKRWFELYGYQTEADALTSLKSAKTLSRRLSVSYKELVEIVQIGFVNPQVDKLIVLRKLAVDATDFLRYEGAAGFSPLTADEKQAFEKRISEVAATVSLSFNDLKTRLDGAFKATKLNELLLLNDPDTGCNFDVTTLRFADGKDADALVFFKINLFVRLWKKLGWTIEETDRAINAFLPKNSLPLTAANIGEAMVSVLIYLAHLKALKGKVNVGKDGILKLLTLWSNLATTGRNPLYGQLFLNSTILKNDPVFDDPLGAYLSKPGLLLKDHMLAVQSALNLTADEIGSILEDRQQRLDTATLSLDSLSLLFRYALTARALKVSVRDLISIKAMSGLDPFKGLSAAPLAELEDDHPFNQTLRFFEIADRIKESGFKVEDLDYLFRHRFDPVGKYRQNSQSLLDLVKTLANGIQRLQSDHSMPADAAAFTDDVLRQKLALALPGETAETFLAMWNGTKEYEAIFPGVVAAANQLDAEKFAAVPALRVSYDKTRQQQHLTVRGVLSDGEKEKLKTDFPGAMLGALLDDVNKQAHDFFDKHLLKGSDQAPFLGFLQAGDFEFLFAPDPEGLTDAAKQQRIRAKRERLGGAFLPFLQQRLIRQLILQTVSNNLAAEPALVETLLTRGDMLADPTSPAQPLLDAFVRAGQSGVSVSYFSSPTGSGTPLPAPSAQATVDTREKPASARSSHFKGYLEVPANGAYRFFAALGKKDATVELRFDHLTDALVSGTAAADNTEISQFAELKAGLLYGFTVDLNNLGTGNAAMSVTSQEMPRGSLDQLKLYPADLVDQISRAWSLLSKALLMLQGFAFSESEIQYLLTHGVDFGNVDLSKLPTSAPTNLAAASALFGAFIRIADLSSLKRELADNTDDLLAIFQNSRRTHPAGVDAVQASKALLDDVCGRLAILTRRDAAKVREAADSLGLTVAQSVSATELRLNATGFSDERGISRLWEVLKVSETLGVSASAVVRWATPAPDFTIARELKDTVKARYEIENWQRIAQPIFDTLRQKQRDALVAHTIHRNGFDRLEQLFEFFLIDPGMEPVVQTSRLRLAISSLQLFIQRCLLNLEPQVSPSVINADHWQWMKRYRVWEANRKIFLFPENWLEPEFRDDKTHLFQELESALLEGDVSNDSVEEAFYKYLKQLEEIARLEIVAMYCDRKPEPDANVFYVVGRTHVLPHKYFYRRYANQMWTPWEPISVEIEGDHLALILWRERLHLFWLTFMEKPNKKSGLADDIPDKSIGQVAKAIAQVSPVKEVEVQLNWTELFQGEWTARKSSSFINLRPGRTFTSFDSKDVFVSAYKEYDSGEERAVVINVGGVLEAAFRVVNKHSEPERASSVYWLGFPYSGTARKVYFESSGALEVTFIEQIKTEDGKFNKSNETTKPILQHGHKYSLLACNELFGIDLEALARVFPNEGIVDAQGRPTEMTKWLLNEYLPTTLTAPFFYQDSENTFFVEPTLTETTIDRWEEWVIPGPALKRNWENGMLDKIHLEPQVPDPRIRFEVDPQARFTLERPVDWVTHPATLLNFNDRLIGETGSVPIAIRDLGGNARVAITSSVIAEPDKTTGASIDVTSTRVLETAVRTNALTVVSSEGLNETSLTAITSTQTSKAFGSIAKLKNI